MDPSIELCRRSLSFTGKPAFTHESLPDSYSFTGKYQLKPTSPPPEQTETRRITISNNIQTATRAFSPVVNADPIKYSKLLDVKDILADVPAAAGRRARDASNPFEAIGNSIFFNRAAVKLANLDALFNFTRNSRSFAIPQDYDTYTFCDIAGGPGGFSTYLHWRKQSSFGYGITLDTKDASLRWAIEPEPTSRVHEEQAKRGLLFNPKHLVRSYGSLYDEARLRKFVDSVGSKGVNLVVADGGFDVDAGSTSPEETKQKYRNEEFLTSRLLMMEILTALLTVTSLNDQGFFVLKTFDTVTEITTQLIFICAMCFEEIVFVKPVSSRPANAEKYLVCRGKRPQKIVQPYIDLLLEANRKYTESTYVTSLYDVKYPEDFSQWMRSRNELFTNMQTLAMRNYLLSLKGVASSQLEGYYAYDIRKFLMIWNLPQ